MWSVSKYTYTKKKQHPNPPGALHAVQTAQCFSGLLWPREGRDYSQYLVMSCSPWFAFHSDKSYMTFGIKGKNLRKEIQRSWSSGWVDSPVAMFPNTPGQGPVVPKHFDILWHPFCRCSLMFTLNTITSAHLHEKQKFLLGWGNLESWFSMGWFLPFPCTIPAPLTVGTSGNVWKYILLSVLGANFVFPRTLGNV